ncbi:MAG: gliding motility protein GldC [Chitinophagaceae bacterium]|nr:gliding motility protein GldC [Chitinophagaceae bacterium]
MRESQINVSVLLDDQKVPQSIRWNATDSTHDEPQQAKAIMLSFWDGSEKTAFRIDLWTKDMKMDEMADFYYQTMVTMGDTLMRSTGKMELVKDLKKFASAFHDKFAGILEDDKLK